MARTLRIYFNAVFGALGGLLGWMLFGEIVSRDWDWWVSAITGGALIGAMIGYFVVGVDAIMDFAWIRFSRYATYGVVLGSLGGAVGFWIGDWVNYALVPTAEEAALAQQLGAIVARGLGWMFFGLAVGASEGIAARSLGKFWYGTLGGALGGFLGGTAFAFLMEAFKKDTFSYTWGQALGLVILGGCIGGLIALVEEVLKPAALRVLRGWREGREFPLLKPASVLGRDEAADILLLRDMQVHHRHAVVRRQRNRFVLANEEAAAGETLVNGEPLTDPRELRDGDRIELGGVLLRFTLRGGAARGKDGK